MLKKILIIVVFISFSNVQYGQDFSKTGTAAAQFLEIPIGAKATAMANTFGAIGDNASTLYWNPAGIASLNRFEIYDSYSPWLSDIKHEFFGLIIPADDKSSFGVGVISVNYGKMERTTIDNPRGTGTTFDAADLAIWASYSRYLIEQVSVGINIKYITQRIWNETASSFAFDAGIMLHPGFYDMKLGLSFQNFGPDLKLDGEDLTRPYDNNPNSTSNPLTDSKLTTQAFSLPTSYSVSLSMSVIGEKAPISSLNSNLLFAVNAIHRNDSREHYSVGAEYGFYHMFFLRGGYNFNTDETGLTYGFGLNINIGYTTFIVDYANLDYGAFDNINVFSITLRL